ncbi:sensor histidine kinase [Mucilaginibacter sp. McL0603]|uniref:sensor histidine kinase n=1 Tax=Mucilaginibacter sp. McL0603 TaxID=3415670 RepID=UPI003CF1ACA9
MKKIYLSLLLLQILFLPKGIAQKVIVFKGDNTVIGQNVSILEDTSKQLDFNSARKSSGFIQSLTQVPNLQLSTSVFWLRFTIKNESPENQLLLSLEYPTLDECEFYYPVKGIYNTETLSDNNSFEKRKYKHQDFLFDINIPKDSIATFYLKVRSNEQMVLPLELGTPQKIAETKLTRDMLWGILVGILLVMILYNTFVFISTKDISYLYYVLYAFFIALTQTSLSGYTYRFIFPNSPVMFNMGIIIFNSLAGIAFSLFAQSFLAIKERMPIMSKLFKLIILLYALTIIVRLLGYAHVSYRMTDVSALIVTVSIYIVIIRLSLKGYRPAKFFLFAWTMFFTGVVLFVLRNLGILPYNSYTNYTMPIGAAFEVILLSLALADRINIFKAEKEKSQEETLKVLQENEKIIREQNVVLELKVNERTHELSESNQELNITLENLKQTQTQLVESEKMASLGQLTAGIAHEINNPINFVTSNINPLKRDIEMVLNALTVIENVSTSDVPTADKLKQIKEYKEQLDFDYLTTEIRHLIKGINEGATRTAEIVKGLRFFSRLDEDDLKKADINEGLESTMVIANNLLNNKIKIIKEFGDLPKVECYPGKLNQAFLNIISNAVYAIQERFENNAGGEITIITNHDKKDVYIRIKDNGIGMDANTQKKVFEPFFTTKDVGEGTGLGMSIAYNIVKKHNGIINVNSSQGEGTEFILQIPINFTDN